MVELLIVLTIVGLLVSLVAPLGVRQLQQARAQEEWMLLERTLSGIAFSSFVGDHETTLQAEGRRLSWSGGPMESRFLDFEQLWFERQEVVFSSNGIADRTELRVRQRMRPRAVQLNRGFVN